LQSAQQSFRRMCTCRVVDNVLPHPYRRNLPFGVWFDVFALPRFRRCCVGGAPLLSARPRPPLPPPHTLSAIPWRIASDPGSFLIISKLALGLIRGREASPSRLACPEPAGDHHSSPLVHPRGHFLATGGGGAPLCFLGGIWGMRSNKINFF